MNTEKLQIMLPKDVTEFTIREGRAVEPLPLKEPKSIAISGDIHAISNFVAIRREQADGVQVLDARTILIEANKNARTIVFNSNPAAHNNTIITAKLEASEELKQFGINSDKTYDRKELLKLLKFSRGYFKDRANYDQVINGLMKVRIKTSAELQQESDNKGNRKNVDEVNSVMSEGFVDKFYLSVPLFKGFAKENIEVEICFEPMNGNVSFWLESVGLKETTEGAIDGIFDAELQLVKDFVIIYK
jgi:hypothetical protein